jgi:hypothetical protein
MIKPILIAERRPSDNTMIYVLYLISVSDERVQLLAKRVSNSFARRTILRPRHDRGAYRGLRGKKRISFCDFFFFFFVIRKQFVEYTT